MKKKKEGLRLSEALPYAAIVVAIGVAAALVILTTSGVTERKLPSHCTLDNFRAASGAMDAIMNLANQSVDTAVRAQEQLDRGSDAPEGFVEERSYLNAPDYYWKAARGFEDIVSLLADAFNSCLETTKEVR